MRKISDEVWFDAVAMGQPPCINRGSAPAPQRAHSMVSFALMRYRFGLPLFTQKKRLSVNTEVAVFMFRKLIRGLQRLVWTVRLIQNKIAVFCVFSLLIVP